MKKSGRARKESRDGASKSVGVLKRPFRKYSSVYRKKKKTTVLLTILLVGLLIYGSLILIEIAQFKRVERKTNALYAAVLAEFPEANEHGIFKNCGYASAKFQKGDLGCGYGFDVQIHEPDLSKANRIANNYQQLLYDQQDLKVSSSAIGLIDLAQKDQFGIADGRNYTINDGLMGIGCSGGVSIESVNGRLSGESDQKEYVQLFFYCGKSPSLIKHYPVTEE